MASPPLALTPALPSELLSYILSLDKRPITLIICQPRDQFLKSLLHNVRPCPPSPRPEPTDDDSLSAETVLESSQTTQHHLLTPTMIQVLTSRFVNVVFVHSLSHLRAYLAVLKPSHQHSTRSPAAVDMTVGEQKLLIVYGLLQLHRDTSEWSAQGISHTLASTVNVGHREQCHVMLIEELVDRDGEAEPDGHESSVEIQVRRRRRDAIRIWDEEVPILSGGGRKLAEGAWSGRKIEIGRIYKRWCRFEAGVWDV